MSIWVYLSILLTVLAGNFMYDFISEEFLDRKKMMVVFKNEEDL